MLISWRTWSYFSSIANAKSFSPYRAADRLGRARPKALPWSKEGHPDSPAELERKITLGFHPWANCPSRCSSCVLTLSALMPLGRAPYILLFRNFQLLHY